MELIDADTRIRERVRAVDEATDGTGAALSGRLKQDLEHLDREAASWPERAKLAREREAPAEIQRRAEAAGAEIAAMRDRLRARRDQLLVAFGNGIALQARLDSVRATIAERRERISAELSTIEDVPIWRQGAIAFPRDEVMANVASGAPRARRPPAAVRRPARRAARRSDRIPVRRPASAAGGRSAARRGRAAPGRHRAGRRAAGRAGIPRLARPEGPVHLLSPDRIRGAAARRHRGDEELRRADSGHRLDAGLGGIRQRVSDIRGDESRARPIAARHSDPAVRAWR